ncbi:hypothetical protein AAMO2058_000464800 [Amorphochlora amoebiformis]
MRSRFIRECIERARASPPQIPLTAKVGLTRRREDLKTEYPDLSLQQRKVMRAVLDGTSVFFTGPAGSGKSYLLDRIIAHLPPEGMYVTASTGRAAVQIGGTTLHSFAGIGLGLRPDTILHDLLRMARRPDPYRRWRSARVLIIDEVSILDAATFDALELIAREIRESPLPFGGIQLVLTGDFLQLPPISNSRGSTGAGTRVLDVGSPRSSRDLSIIEAMRGMVERDAEGVGRFAFEAAAWRKAVPVAMQLEGNMRAQGDETMLRMLEEVRFGVVSDDTLRTLKDLTRPSNVNETFGRHTKIYPTRQQAQEENHRCLQALEGAAFLFTSIDGSEESKGIFVERKRHTDGAIHDPNGVAELWKGFPVGHELTLKIGAEVILVRNQDPSKGLVNGSRGIIVAFERFEMPEKMRLGAKNYKKKSQRGRGPEVDEGVWSKISPDMILPVVKFSNGHRERIVPTVFSTSISGSCGLTSKKISRTQLPLILGWAMTIHRCQGMTLDRAQISLKGAFEVGQAYVALSRVRSLNNIRLTDFDPEAIRAEPNAIDFTRSISKAVEASCCPTSGPRKQGHSDLSDASPAPMPPPPRPQAPKAPDLLGTYIPKPTIEDLKHRKDEDLMRRLYSAGGKRKKMSTPLRQEILQYDPLAFERHAERIYRGEYSEGTASGSVEVDFKKLQDRAGVNLPQDIRRTPEVEEFLRAAARKQRGDDLMDMVDDHEENELESRSSTSSMSSMFLKWFSR